MLPDKYFKGEYEWKISSDPANPTTKWTLKGSQECANEDINFDGILNPGEDANQDGHLWPGQVASLPSSGAITTDGNGETTVTLTYTKSYSTWVSYKLLMSAQVAGTEGQAIFSYQLNGVLTDYQNQDVPPPGRASPYGTKSNCASPD
jgi:hypothetical protein